MATKTTITLSTTEANLLDLLLKYVVGQISEADFSHTLQIQYGYSGRTTAQYIAEQLLTAIRVS